MSFPDALTSVLLGFLLEKKIGVNQPKRLENARILIANTAMDCDKIKVLGKRGRMSFVSLLMLLG